MSDNDSTGLEPALSTDDKRTGMEPELSHRCDDFYFSREYQSRHPVPNFEVWSCNFDLNNQKVDAISITGWLDTPDTQKWNVHIVMESAAPCMKPRSYVNLRLPIASQKWLSGKFFVMRSNMQDGKFYCDYESIEIYTS
jgi:hypothetical protein